MVVVKGYALFMILSSKALKIIDVHFHSLALVVYITPLWMLMCLF